MRRHCHRGHLAGSALAALTLFTFDATDSRDRLPVTVGVVATHLLVVTAAALVATSAVRIALAHWTARREAQETAAVEASYRLGWAAATAAEEPARTLRLVSAPRQR